MKVKSESEVAESQPHGLQPTRLLHPWDFPGKSTGADEGSIPGGRAKIPHAAEQLSPRAATAKPRGPQLESLRATNYTAQELWNPWAAPTYNQDPTCHN